VGAGRPGGGRPLPPRGSGGITPGKFFGNLHYCRCIFVPFWSRCLAMGCREKNT